MQNEDYILHGMQQAADRYDPNVEIERYLQGRDKVVPYKPTEPQPEPVDTGAFTPNQIRAIKAIGIGGSMVTFWATVFKVAATGALNTVFQWGAAGVFLLILFSGFKGAATPGASAETGGGSQGGTSGGNQYNQQNNYNNCKF